MSIRSFRPSLAKDERWALAGLAQAACAAAAARFAEDYQRPAPELSPVGLADRRRRLAATTLAEFRGPLAQQVERAVVAAREAADDLERAITRGEAGLSALAVTRAGLQSDRLEDAAPAEVAAFAAAVHEGDVDAVHAALCLPRFGPSAMPALRDAARAQFAIRILRDIGKDARDVDRLNCAAQVVSQQWADAVADLEHIARTGAERDGRAVAADLVARGNDPVRARLRERGRELGVLDLSTSIGEPSVGAAANADADEVRRDAAAQGEGRRLLQRANAQ